MSVDYIKYQRVTASSSSFSVTSFSHVPMIEFSLADGPVYSESPDCEARSPLDADC